MNKSDLVQLIANRSTYLTKEDIELCTDERFKELKETIERNKTLNKK